MCAQVRKALPAFGGGTTGSRAHSQRSMQEILQVFQKKKSITDRETPVMRLTIEIIIFLNNIRYTRGIQKDTAAEWRIISAE